MAFLAGPTRMGGDSRDILSFPDRASSVPLISLDLLKEKYERFPSRGRSSCCDRCHVSPVVTHAAVTLSLYSGASYAVLIGPRTTTGCGGAPKTRLRMPGCPYTITLCAALHSQPHGGGTDDNTKDHIGDYCRRRNGHISIRRLRSSRGRKPVVHRLLQVLRVPRRRIQRPVRHQERRVWTQQHLDHQQR